MFQKYFSSAALATAVILTGAGCSSSAPANNTAPPTDQTAIAPTSNNASGSKTISAVPGVTFSIPQNWTQEATTDLDNRPTVGVGLADKKTGATVVENYFSVTDIALQGKNADTAFNKLIAEETKSHTDEGSVAVGSVTGEKFSSSVGVKVVVKTTDHVYSINDERLDDTNGDEMFANFLSTFKF